jgi:hypothetical protein
VSIDVRNGGNSLSASSIVPILIYFPVGVARLPLFPNPKLCVGIFDFAFGDENPIPLSIRLR